MKSEDIIERLQDTEQVLSEQAGRIEKLETKEVKTMDIAIPDYSTELNVILQELRNINNNDKADQVLSRVTSIQETLKKQPVPVNKQWRVLLFPETNQGQYYKIVFGRLIPWGFGFIGLTYLFICGYRAEGIYQQNINKEQVQREQVHYERAWRYLQQHSKKKTIAAMKEAWEKSGN
jgi:hypothetical protein